VIPPLHYEFPPPSVIYTAAFHFLLALAPLRVREEGRASQLVGGVDMPDVPNAYLNKPMLTSWGSDCWNRCLIAVCSLNTAQ